MSNCEFTLITRQKKVVPLRNGKPTVTSIRRDDHNTIQGVQCSRHRYIHLKVNQAETTDFQQLSFDLHDHSSILEHNVGFSVDVRKNIHLKLNGLHPELYKRQENVHLYLFCFNQGVLVSVIPFIVSWWKQRNKCE